jgi:mono/diheme cytochrome c family protein
MRVFVVILLAWAWFCAVAWAQDRATIDAGEALYQEHCQGCHGEKLRNPATAFDL